MIHCHFLLWFGLICSVYLPVPVFFVCFILACLCCFCYGAGDAGDECGRLQGATARAFRRLCTESGADRGRWKAGGWQPDRGGSRCMMIMMHSVQIFVTFSDWKPKMWHFWPSLCSRCKNIDFYPSNPIQKNTHLVTQWPSETAWMLEDKMTLDTSVSVFSSLYGQKGRKHWISIL